MPRLPYSLLAFPDLSSPGNTGHKTRRKFLLSVYPLFKTFQGLCVAQRIKSQILNMTHETPYNQAFTVSLASSPKHVILKFFPLIMFPLLQVTVQTCYFLSLTLGMVLSPPYTFPSSLSYPGESSCPFFIFIIPWEQLFSQSGL